MENTTSKKKLYLLLILIACFIFVATGCQLPIKTTKTNNNTNLTVLDKPQPGQVAIIDSNVIVTTPLSNNQISSPVKIEGRARVFEGTVLYRIKDVWNKVIAEGFTTANMGAPEWGFYSAEASFEMPASSKGWVEVYTQSAKDGSDQNLIRLPVIFADFENPKVTIYFSNINEDPDLTDCSEVYQIERELEPTNRLALRTIEDLLKGVDEDEMKEGFLTNLPEGVKVQKLEIKDGVASIDFNQAFQEDVAGSCRVTAIRAQITETLLQFDEVDEVVISIDGETEDILQP